MLPPINKLPPDVIQAFGGAQLSPALLASGTALYRFSAGEIKRPTEPFASAWWSECSGLIEVLLGAKASGKSLEQFVRQKSAVLRAWNNMNCLVIVRLIRPKEAYRGRVEFQNEAKAYMDRNSAKYKGKFTKPVFFGGGGSQVWVPELLLSDFNVLIPVGTVYISDDVDAIIDLLVSYRLV